MTSDVDGAARFAAVWQRCVATPPAPDAVTVHADLCRLLGAPSRLFHNLDHIRDCVRRFDEVASLLQHPDAVEIALWFHDAIYEPGEASNEHRSANLFLAQSTGAPPVFRRRVCGLILTTRHIGGTRGSDRRFIEDIDLAGFAAPWEDFMRSGDLLRAEFAAHPDAQYYPSQVGFLLQLQRRPRFFSTDYFHDRYEARARHNVRRLLEDLARRGFTAPAAS